MPERTADGRGVAVLGEQQANSSRLRGEGLGGFAGLIELRKGKAARLLGSLEQDFLPASRALCGGGEKAFFAACGSQGDNSANAQLGGLFDSPFECVELDDGE